MYKIVFLDDEPWALRDIRTIVQWEELGFSDIWTFTDPRKALVCIAQEKPDVVCTDVRMPDLSGIDLIRQCRSLCPSTLFVVVSAYAEFEYARRAMECGAFSYVLKPLEEEEVQKLSRRITTKLAERDHQTVSEALRSITLYTMFGGDTGQPRSLVQRAGLLAAPYRVCISSKLPQETCGHWFPVYGDLVLGILLPDADLPQSLLCGCSVPAKDPAAFPEMVRCALIGFFTLRFYEIPEGVLEYDGRERIETNEVRRLLDSCQGRNMENVSACLGQMKETAMRERYSISRLTLFYNSLLRSLINAYPQAGLQEELREFSSCFRMYGIMHNADVFFESIRIQFETCMQQTGDTDDMRNVIASVVRYIDRHYTEELTLELLTEQFGVSLSYLCHCFKRETGQSFTKYLTQRRLTRACELLARSDLTVTEIGEQMGYTDYCYFTKGFKKHIGISPSKYRMEKRNG